jgi:hypothetical protein
LKANQTLTAFLDKPAEPVSVPKQIKVTPEMYVKLISAGSNPYEAADLKANRRRFS